MTLLQDFNKERDPGNPKAPFSNCFEDTFQKSYSHGLEKIYTLEEIDLASVRPFSQTASTFLSPSAEVVSLSSPSFPQTDLFAASNELNLNSWITQLINGLDKRKTSLLLERYQLSSLLFLSPTESFDLKRASSATKEQWYREIVALLRQEEKKRGCFLFFQQLVDLLVRPWIYQEVGFITEEEILNKLTLLGRIEEVKGILNFAKEIYFDNAFPFACYLYQAEEKIFCADQGMLSDYSEVIRCALSYFYKSTICYKMDELVYYVEKELSYSWNGFEPGFVKKCLKNSSFFRWDPLTDLCTAKNDCSDS